MMSDKEENPPARRGPEAENRNKKREKKRSTPPTKETAPDKATKEGDPEAPESKKPEPETIATLSGAESVEDNSEGKDNFSPENLQTKPAFDSPERETVSSGQGKFFLGFIVLAVALILVAIGEAYYTHSLVEKERQAREALSGRLMEQIDTQIKSQVASQTEKQPSETEGQIHQIVTNLK